MARPEKVAVVEEIRTKLADADAAILTEYRGLTVTELATLRGALRPAATEYKVFKNTLARRAIDSTGAADLTTHMARWAADPELHYRWSEFEPPGSLP